MTIEEYKARREARIERCRELAEKATAQSRQASTNAHQIMSYIPMGQPILVGHHSERRHRRDLDRIDRAMRRCVERSKTADYWARRAHAAESPCAISSDDPEAIQKLRAELAEVEAKRARMVAINKALRSKDDAALATLGHVGRTGFNSLSLGNKSANARRIRQRIAELQRRETSEPFAATGEGFAIEEDRDDCRVRIRFDVRQSDEICKRLTRSGWKWSRLNQAWQRQNTANGVYAARQLAVQLPAWMNSPAQV